MRYIQFRQEKREGCYLVSNEVHRDLEIYYLTQGERLYFVENRTYHLTEGSVMVVCSNRIHKTSAAGQHSHARMLLEVDPAFFSELAAAYPMVSFDYLQSRTAIVIPPDSAYSAPIRSLFEEIYHLNTDKPYGFEEEIACNTFKILLNIQRFLLLGTDQSALCSGKHQKVYEIAEYISQHFDTINSLDELSARFFISKYYLSHTFKEVTGLSVIAFLNATRIQRACALLSDRQISIARISTEVGFPSTTRFTEAFRRIEGMTPREYRQRLGDRSIRG